MKTKMTKALFISLGLAVSAPSFAFGDGNFKGGPDRGDFGGFKANNDAFNGGQFKNAPVFNHADGSKLLPNNGGAVFHKPEPVVMPQNQNAFTQNQNAIKNFQANNAAQFNNQFPKNNFNKPEFANKNPGKFNLNTNNNQSGQPITNRPMQDFKNHPTPPQFGNTQKNFDGTITTSKTTITKTHTSKTTAKVYVNKPDQVVITRPLTNHPTIINTAKPVYLEPGPVITNKPYHPAVINKPIVINTNHGGYNKPPVIINNNNYYNYHGYGYHYYPNCYYYNCGHNYYYSSNDVNDFLAVALAVSLTANVVQYASASHNTTNVVYAPSPYYYGTTFVPYSTTYLPVTNTPAQFVPYVNPDVNYASSSHASKASSTKTTSTSSTAPVYVTVNTTINNTTPDGTTTSTTTTTSSSPTTTSDNSDTTQATTPTTTVSLLDDMAIPVNVGSYNDDFSVGVIS